jgi:hypothetical protein
MFAKDPTRFFEFPPPPTFVETINALHDTCRALFKSDFHDISHGRRERKEFFDAHITRNDGPEVVTFKPPVWSIDTTNHKSGKISVVLESRMETGHLFVSASCLVKTYIVPVPLWLIAESSFNVVWTDNEAEYENAMGMIVDAKLYLVKYDRAVKDLNTFIGFEEE